MLLFSPLMHYPTQISLTVVANVSETAMRSVLDARLGTSIFRLGV